MAWLLVQGDDIAPIPGTKRVARVEENTAAEAYPKRFSKESVVRFSSTTPNTHISTTWSAPRTRAHALSSDANPSGSSRFGLAYSRCSTQ
jgi:hypothetical protein